MKTAEQMMCEWMESQLKDNQTFTINSEQYLNVWNWFQECELVELKHNMIDMPDLYDGSIGTSPSAPDNVIKWTGNEDAWKHAHAGGNMTKYDKRTDTNHEEIREGLRKAGYEVEDTSWIGRGHVDLMVRGDFRTVMLEIKYLDAKLTDAEKELHTKFSGCGWHVVRTLEQALDVMRKETI